jgi:DNA-binding LytR/AlgR family response regulator
MADISVYDDENFYIDKISEIIENFSPDLIKTCSNDDYIICGNTLNSFGRVKYNSIVYVEKQKKYVEFYIDDGSVIRERTTLADVQNRLNPDYFVLICKGVLINIEHVKLFEKDMIKMDNNVTLYMSKKHATEVKKSILNFFGVY